MPFRNEDGALRARLDAVLDENAALKEELARRDAAPKPAKPEPKPAREPKVDPDRAPRAATERDPQARARLVVVAALLTFVSMPGIVYTVLAFTSGGSLGPAIVMDGVALLAWGSMAYARYRINKGEG